MVRKGTCITLLVISYMYVNSNSSLSCDKEKWVLIRNKITAGKIKVSVFN